MAQLKQTASAIRVDEVAAATSRAVVEALRDIKLDRPELVLNPRIWYGIWVDIQQTLPQLGAGGVRGPG